MFGKNIEITVAAKAYTDKPITEEQRKSYTEFFNNERNYICTISNEIKKYVNEHLYPLAEDWPGAKTIKDISELGQIVSPKTLIFKQDGTAIMLLDCVLDVENGIGVKIIPKFAIGPQDIFL